MRKTICVILVVSLLALSLAGASPSAWAWLGQANSSATSEVPQEASTVPSATQGKDSTSSESTSADVVVMSKADLATAVALIEAGQEDAKKSKMSVEEAEKYAIAQQTAAQAYSQLMRTRFMLKGVAGWNLQTGLDFGFGFGLIFRDTILLEAELTKVGGFKDFGNFDDYTARVGVGIVF